MMRIALIMGPLLLAGNAAMAANADYFLKIEGVSREAPSGPIYLKVSGGDLDGDGVPDDSILRLNCAGGELRTVHYNVKSPRDSASGQASGKRTHHPVTFVKEWGAATPQLMAVKPTYDLKKVEGSGARVVDGGGWTSVTLANADGLCPVAEDAARKATKSRSNIQNN